jgi:hypothetical protein
MKGKERGVQNRLLDINPKVFYTLYGYNSLDLIVSNIANSCPKAITIFGIVHPGAEPRIF